MRTKARILEGEALVALSLKRCGRCKEVLHLDSFYAGRGLGGRRAACRACLAVQSNKWRDENHDRVLAAERRRLLKPEVAARRRESVRRYSAANREKLRLNAEMRRRAKGVPKRPVGLSTPIEVLRKRCRDYKARNPEKVREYSRRAISTPAGKLRNRVRARVRECLRLGWSGGKTFEALGYTIDELRAHLERQFVKGMGWHNMSEWHIDHIVPLSDFEIDSLDSPDFKRAWGLANLRPLWAKDNLQKQAKVQTLL